MNIKEILFGIGIIGIVLFSCGCIDYSVVPGGYKCDKDIDGGVVQYAIVLREDGRCALGTGIQLTEFYHPEAYVGRWEQENDTIYMEFEGFSFFGGPWQQSFESVVAEWDGKTLTIISAGKNPLGGSIIDEGMILKKTTNKEYL